MKAYQCDRCHNFVTGNPEMEIPAELVENFTGIEQYPAFREYHLCENCLKDLRDWWTYGRFLAEAMK